MDSFWGEVYGFLLKRTENENDAEDIAVQTFSKAFNKLDSFNEEYKFSTWLIAIAKNIHFDLIRKRKSLLNSNTIDADDEALTIIDGSPSAEDKIIIEQNLVELLKQIKKLKPNYQEIIHLRYFQEKSIKQIANQLDETENNVKVKLLRARKLLAEYIKNN
ncbi:MAG: sigma-70 family RNA polymerase sigma factor [Flavobacteriaceae bacterium]|nr:sigma-70 family RNA polymerase sigma factor [Flavobacteriaceae bacterium]